MAGPLFLALLVAGPRSGERVTIAAEEIGEPPQVIDVPDRVIVHTRDGGKPVGHRAPNTARYRLTGHDERRNAYVYVHVLE